MGAKKPKPIYTAEMDVAGCVALFAALPALAEHLSHEDAGQIAKEVYEAILEASPSRSGLPN